MSRLGRRQRAGGFFDEVRQLLELILRRLRAVELAQDDDRAEALADAAAVVFGALLRESGLCNWIDFAAITQRLKRSDADARLQFKNDKPAGIIVVLGIYLPFAEALHQHERDPDAQDHKPSDENFAARSDRRRGMSLYCCRI